MKIEVVIAKYKENVEWILHVEKADVVVYDKSIKEIIGDNLSNKYRWIPMENIGREAHTYLFHLIHEYDNLADITVFCQGNPFPHSPAILQNIEVISNGNIYLKGYMDLGYIHLKSDRNGYSPIPDQPYHIGGLEVGKLVDLIWVDNKEMQELEIFDFSAGACFCIDRESIRNKPKSWYEHILRCCESVGEGYPWVMERLWPYIFR